MPKEEVAPEAMELKQQLAEGAFRSIIDLILESLAGLLQKLLRRSDPITPWFSALILATLIALLGFLFATLSGGVSGHGIRTLLLGAGVAFLFFIIPRNINHRILRILHDHLLEKVKTKDGLSDLQSWLHALSSRRWPLLLGILYVGMNILYGGFFLENVNFTIEIVAIGLPLFFIAGMMLYFLLLLLLLPGRLGRCHFKLNALNPASSEVVSCLSNLFNYISYMIAFLLAAVALFTISLVTFEMSNLILHIPVWLILIVIFVVSQRSLTRIIKRTKRESLNQVEAQMEAHKQRWNLADQETMQALTRLWDYHDRILATRDSVLDLNGVMNFINTLLIPLIGYLFANIGSILNLLVR